MRFVILLSIFIYMVSAEAKDREFELRKGLFSFGNLTQFMNSIQTDTSGKTNSFDIRPYLSGGLEFALPKQKYYLNSEIGLTLPKSTADGGALMTIMFLRADVGYRFYRGRLKALLGTSLIMTMLKGNGGTVTLSNGGSPTTFYRPEETRTAYNNTLDLGLEYYFNRKWTGRFQMINYALFDEERRQLSYTLSLNYYWDMRGKVNSKFY